MTPLSSPSAFDEVIITDGGLVHLETALTVGTMQIASGGHLSHEGEGAGIEIAVSDSLTIDSGGSINVDAKGYGSVSGPGAGTSAYGPAGGAGYGGVGGPGYASGTGGPAYGSATAPIDLGSGGVRHVGYILHGGIGGGAMRLTVAGTLTLNGSLTADGTAGETYCGGGSGGSIYVTAGTLVGSGSISADGGDGTSNGGGGAGGRIALYCQDATGFDLSTVTVSGGEGWEPGETGSLFSGEMLFVLRSDPAGLLRTAVDHIDVVFTRPIDPATFTANDVELRGSDGLIPITDIDNLFKIGSTFGWFLIIFGIELAAVYLYFYITNKIAKKKLDEIKLK